MLKSFDETTLLIGLGAARTGTRWMSNYFANHPHVLMSPIRVLHYFDARYEPKAYGRFDDMFKNRQQQRAARGAKFDDDSDAVLDRIRMITDESAYIDYFRKRWAGEKVFCDITPSYAFLGAEAYAGMNQAHRKVRFLFSMRNPIDRHWSTLTKKRTDDPSFDPYTELDRSMKGARRVYRDTITALEAAVPAEAIKYIFYEEFFNEKAIADLCDFLEVPPAPAAFDTPLNRSDPMPLDPDRRAIAYRHFEPVFRFVYERFKGQLPRSWLADMEQFANLPDVAPSAIAG